MLEFFGFIGAVSGEIFRQNLVHRYLSQNPAQVLFVNVVKVVIDDVFYGLDIFLTFKTSIKRDNGNY